VSKPVLQIVIASTRPGRVGLVSCGGATRAARGPRRRRTPGRRPGRSVARRYGVAHDNAILYQNVCLPFPLTST
jgi:hypothetical protein